MVLCQGYRSLSTDVPRHQIVRLGRDESAKRLSHIADVAHHCTPLIADVRVALGNGRKAVYVKFRDRKVNDMTFRLYRLIPSTGELVFGLAFIGMLDFQLDFSAGNSALIEPNAAVVVLILLSERIGLGSDGDSDR